MYPSKAPGHGLLCEFGVYMYLQLARASMKLIYSDGETAPRDLSRNTHVIQG